MRSAARNLESDALAQPAAIMRRRVIAAAALLLFAAVLMRGMILFSGQRYLRSDEAVVGLMAKHIVTRGERPMFLYGQNYGGGHAIAAYVAAPFFALFGRSAIILTGITAVVSVINILLLWIILRRYFDEWVALAGAGLYAFSPPMVYQSFLVNGGTESFGLALVALMFFLRAYLEEKHVLRNAAVAGLFAGAAYFAMDYALLYVIAFLLLWAVAGQRRKWACMGILVAGFMVACLPLIIHNLTHDFAHLRRIFAGPSGAPVGFIEHFAGALWHTITQGLAVFFSGEIDDYKNEAVGLGAWLHAGIAMAAVAVLLYEQRNYIWERLKRLVSRGRAGRGPSIVLLPLVFIGVYLGMYCAAGFSLPEFRTPRYFLPLCPFLSLAIALCLLWKRPALMRNLGMVVILALMAQGALVSTNIGIRPRHEELGIATFGPELDNLARWLQENHIRTAMAPYEIQARLLFATDEEVMVSCGLLSRLPRYLYYEHEVARRVMAASEECALIFRRDFRFAVAAANEPVQTGRGLRLLQMHLDLQSLGEQGRRMGEEFVVFPGITPAQLRRMLPADPRQKNQGASINSRPGK